MWKGVDGIDETTWPGVYNRSRLPGRDDYFELPDWNTYVEGGKAYDLAIPAGERGQPRRDTRRGLWRPRLVGGRPAWRSLARRPQGVVRSVDDFAAREGGRLRFTNVAQETPIQEIWAYDVGAGEEPEGTLKLSYSVNPDAAPAYANLAPLTRFIEGRYPGRRARDRGRASRRRFERPRRRGGRRSDRDRHRPARRRQRADRPHPDPRRASATRSPRGRRRAPGITGGRMSMTGSTASPSTFPR